jgi:hypothetical protein
MLIFTHYSEWPFFDLWQDNVEQIDPSCVDKVCFCLIKVRSVETLYTDRDEPFVPLGRIRLRSHWRKDSEFTKISRFDYSDKLTIYTTGSIEDR